jgi:uncharacterized protein (TIGR00299 family) protein
MTTLYLDLFSGISGDMFIGALLDLGVDFGALEAELLKLGVEGYHLHSHRGQKCGISGVKFDVHLGTHHHGEGDVVTQRRKDAKSPEEQSHEHTHEHEHEHGHEPHSHEHAHKHGHDHDHPEGRLPPHGVPARAGAPPLGPLPDFLSSKFSPGLPLPSDPHPVPPAYPVQIPVPPSHLRQSAESADNSPHVHGRNFQQIRLLIGSSSLSPWVKEKAVAVFQRIATAEGQIHGVPPEEVHFHEVGAVDSIIDIVGACIALELLGRPRVLASRIVEGTGWVTCAHGNFPVPAPATLAILGHRGIAVTQCDEPHELVTPTGAALLAEFTEEFGPMTNLVARRIGIGLGARDNRTRPNVLRAILSDDSSPSFPTPLWETDTITVLESNLDDITPELLGGFLEKTMEAGALDVFFTPIQMKKNRPGVLLSVLCAAAEAERFTEMILRETSAFGVRRSTLERRKLHREFQPAKTPWGEVTIKLGRLGQEVVQAAPEYESCRSLAARAGVAVRLVFESARAAARDLITTRPPH